MEITKLPNKILGKKTRLAKPEDIKAGLYADLISRMRIDMVKNQGVGLAANQVGQDISIFVIDKKLAEEAGVPDAYINPEITDYSKEEEVMEEGCLSIPGFWTGIRRPKKVMFKALDEKGNKMKFRARGFLARVIQHETDHLNGTHIKNRSEEQK